MDIHNLRLLETIYKDDLKAYEKIAIAYNNEALMVILTNCENVAYFFDEFTDDQEKLSKMLHSKEFSMMVRRRFSFWQIGHDRHFYFKIFTKIYDTKAILSEISDETVLSVYKNFSKRNYKKRTEHFREILTKINQMPPDDNDVIWELISSNDFIMRYRATK